MSRRTGHGNGEIFYCVCSANEFTGIRPSATPKSVLTFVPKEYNSTEYYAYEADTLGKNNTAKLS